MSIDSYFYIVAQSHQLKPGKPLQVRLGERHLALLRGVLSLSQARQAWRNNRNLPLS